MGKRSGKVQSEFDTNFASPSDYDDGFVESDSTRYEREQMKRRLHNKEVMQHDKFVNNVSDYENLSVERASRMSDEALCKSYDDYIAEKDSECEF